MKYLPPLAMAVFVGALFSALMSSADGGVLAPASIFGQNILRAFKQDMSERELLWSIRWAILGVGLFALVTALYFQNVYTLMVKSFSILFVGLIIPMTAALYWPRANNPGAVASILVGMGSWLALEVAGIDYPADLICGRLGTGHAGGRHLSHRSNSPGAATHRRRWSSTRVSRAFGEAGISPPFMRKDRRPMRPKTISGALVLLLLAGAVFGAEGDAALDALIAPERSALIWTEQAIRHCDGIMRYFRQSVPKLLERAPSPSLNERLSAASEDYQKRLINYKHFLETDLKPRSTGSFAIVGENYNRMLEDYFLGLFRPRADRFGETTLR